MPPSPEGDVIQKNWASLLIMMINETDNILYNIYEILVLHVLNWL